MRDADPYGTAIPDFCGGPPNQQIEITPQIFSAWEALPNGRPAPSMYTVLKRRPRLNQSASVRPIREVGDPASCREITRLLRKLRLIKATARVPKCDSRCKSRKAAISEISAGATRSVCCRFISTSTGCKWPRGSGSDCVTGVSVMRQSQYINFCVGCRVYGGFVFVLVLYAR